LQKPLTDATTVVTNKFYIAKQDAIKAKTQVADGTLNELIEDTFIEYDLPNNSIKHQTVYYCMKHNNLGGQAHQKVSPLACIEPLIVEWCLKMATIGIALHKKNVFELVNELIAGTEASKTLEEFKKKRNLPTRDGETIVVGRRWYELFIKRNKEVLKQG
jgi:hypothetical protein